MKIKDMLNVVLPTIFKSDLQDTLYNTKKELVETTVPIYNDLMGTFSSWDFKSKEVKRLTPTFNTIVKKRQGNMITTIKNVLDNMVLMCDRVKPMVDKNFEKNTINSALSFRKAQYLQFIEAVRFYTEYARLFANYVVIAETAEFDPGNTIDRRLTPKQKEKVEKGFNSFCLLTNSFNENVATVIKLLEDVPDVIIDAENIEMTEASLGKARIDPLRFGFISVDRNPFYAIQIKLALMAHKRYEKAKEERELLLLRLSNLNNSQQGEPDPKVQKEIEYYENRIQKLDYQIAKEEEEYG